MFNIILILSTLAAHSLAAARPRVVRMQTSRVGRELLVKRDYHSVTLGNAVSQGLYYVNASVGTPKQNIALQIDTGSSDVWVFGPGSCDARTSHCLGRDCKLIFPRHALCSFKLKCSLLLGHGIDIIFLLSIAAYANPFPP
jgi:hypothetical protein